MNETNTFARVYYTLSQRFIETNAESLCSIIFGINSINNLNVTLTHLVNGGFKADINEKYLPRSFDFVMEDKREVMPKLNKVLVEKNRRINKFIVQNECDFLFFPMSFMEPVTIYPNYYEGKSSTIIKSWNVVYKLEVNVYKDTNTNEEVYANVVDLGITLTLSPNCKIIGINYNLLPFKSSRNFPLYQPTDQPGISQLIYLLGLTDAVIAPFYLSVTEGTFIPATQESFVPWSEKKSRLTFDVDRVVVWLTNTENDNNTDIKDANGQIVEKNQYVIPPIGAKLIRLKPDSEYSEKTKCFYWWDGDYHIGSFNEKFLGDNWQISSDSMGQVFINDLRHLDQRLKNDGLKNTNANEFYKPFCNFIENYSYIANENIENAIISLSNKIKIDLNDKPGTITRIKDLIFNVYNPQIEVPYYSNIIKKKYKDILIIVPLSENWFKIHPSLMTWFEKSKLKSQIKGLSGSSRVSAEDTYLKLKRELLFLPTILKKINIDKCSTNVKQKIFYSPEAKWLMSLDKDSFDKDYGILLFIDDASWNYGDELSETLDDGIGLESSLGPFRFNAIFSIIIHELTVCGGGRLEFLESAHGVDLNNLQNLEPFSDTHISSNQTKRVWNWVSDGEFDKIKNDFGFIPGVIDYLYQFNRYYACICASIIMRELKYALK